MKLGVVTGEEGPRLGGVRELSAEIVAAVVNDGGEPVTVEGTVATTLPRPRKATMSPGARPWFAGTSSAI